jgi:hypothetical protein
MASDRNQETVSTDNALDNSLVILADPTFDHWLINDQQTLQNSRHGLAM